MSRMVTMEAPHSTARWLWPMFSRSGSRPRAFLSASAVGFYGNRGDEVLTEDSPHGDFKFMLFPGLCWSWEHAAQPAREVGLRVVNPRIGVVLTPKGGALGKQLLPFKLGLGAVLGSGKQWMGWIHHEDLVGLFQLPLANSAVCGPLNGTAPNPVTNKEFGHALGRALGRPSFMPTPKLAHTKSAIRGR